jgi:hypothetical protein
MRRLNLSIVFLVLFSFSVSSSEPGIWLTESEWLLIQNLWLSSDQIYPSIDESMMNLELSQKVTDSYLTDFDKLAEEDNTSLTNLDENNSDKTTLSNNLDLTTDSLEITTTDLEKSFWKSTGGTILMVTGSFLIGAALGTGLGFYFGSK